MSGLLYYMRGLLYYMRGLMLTSTNSIIMQTVDGGVDMVAFEA